VEEVTAIAAILSSIIVLLVILDLVNAFNCILGIAADADVN
jgi:hypothetical protein